MFSPFRHKSEPRVGNAWAEVRRAPEPRNAGEGRWYTLCSN
jgi:hypothetical protein